VADERTNSIVLLASEGDTDNIRKLIRSLDKETPRGQAKIHVYYLANANAEELAKVLQDIPQKDATGKTPGRKTAPVVSDKVRISADKATNSLIIMADMEDYVVLESIIKKIDIPRAMVYIEALIMEVNVSKDFRLGTEWIAGGIGAYNNREGFYGGGFSAGGFGGDAGTIGTATSALTGGAFSPPPGFSLGLVGESIDIGGVSFPTISAIIQAYKKDNDVNILSTPQILTTDNQEARISVGSNIPFQTQATANDTGTTIYNSFEYRDVGKTLKITPHISKDRMVRLELSLEVSEISGTQTAQPTTLKRTVETTTIVQDNHTVVLGGLIDNKLDNTKYKVPCLGDIPGLGFLFSQKSNSHDKTNLYIFLTPRVIQNPDEASKVAKEKRDQIDQLREENIKLYGHQAAAQAAPPAAQPTVESYQYHETHEPEMTTPPEPDAAAMQDANAAAQSNAESTTAADTPLQPTMQAPAQTSAVTAPVTDQAAQPVPQDPPSAPSEIISSAPDPTAAPLPATRSTDTATDGDPAPHGAVAPQSSDDKSAEASAQKAFSGGSYTVQVASVASVQQADQVLKKLTERGYAAYTVQSTVGGKTWYRVRIGFFHDSQSTHELMKRLKSDQYDPFLIKF